jgi:hypothetical protein
MRMMLLVELDTPTANGVIRDGRIEELLNGILEALRPEAAYFYGRGGRRAFTLVVDAPDAASLPSLAEPFWMELNASVEAFPCMNADELREGLSRLG